jgi:alkanesulfonate monooxygenase SsuD/methylene tetrahydromethanopterin reductase-like flavin-dependent oxidoreductase (luciferase family)
MVPCSEPGICRGGTVMELGVYTFGEFTTAPNGFDPAPVHQRLKGIVDAAVIADEAGLDVFAVGEHHRRDMAVSAPEVVLAHIAARTHRIRLASAVTVLSTQDPVRVFEQFATLDQLSDGRAEVIAGRGAFVESFPLFGYRLEDYDALFDEKIRLLLQLRDNPTVTWSGRFRSPLADAEISPQPLQRPLPIWIGVGGTPASFARAGVLGVPLYMGLFGDPRQFVRHVELYRQAAEQEGHDPAKLKTGSGGHMFIRRRSQDARDDLYPYYSAYWKASGRAPFGDGFPRSLYDSWVDGGLMVGSPQQVIDKILLHHETLGIDRYIGTYDIGGHLPQAWSAETMELFATEVAPVIRRETTRSDLIGASV